MAQLTKTTRLAFFWNSRWIAQISDWADGNGDEEETLVRIEAKESNSLFNTVEFGRTQLVDFVNECAKMGVVADGYSQEN